LNLSLKVSKAMSFRDKGDGQEEQTESVWTGEKVNEGARDERECLKRALERASEQAREEGGSGVHRGGRIVDGTPSPLRLRLQGQLPFIIIIILYIYIYI
jgi:hypothetical protein